MSGLGYTLGALLAAGAGYMAWANRKVDAHIVRVAIPELNARLEGLRVAHISDMHGFMFGRDQAALVDPIRAFAPDVIAITGDLADSRTEGFAACITLCRWLVQIAPVVRVNGNHELCLPAQRRAVLDEALHALGVTLLSNQALRLERGGAPFLLCGCEDIALQLPRYTNRAQALANKDLPQAVMREHVRQICQSAAGQAAALRLLLVHRPFFWSVYRNAGCDAVLAGHAHGGQLHLERLLGYQLDHGAHFSELDAGLYNKDGLPIYVSRGLANSVIRVRFHTPAELPLLVFTRA